MLDLLLDRPAPDFDELVRVLKGEHLPRLRAASGIGWMNPGR